MCGIVGYLGYRNTMDVLLKGLTALEYRGYDSAGVAVLHPGGGMDFHISGLAEGGQDAGFGIHAVSGHPYGISCDIDFPVGGDIYPLPQAGLPLKDSRNEEQG